MHYFNFVHWDTNIAIVFLIHVYSCLMLAKVGKPLGFSSESLSLLASAIVIIVVDVVVVVVKCHTLSSLYKREATGHFFGNTTP